MGFRIPTPALLDGAALFLDFDGTLVDIASTPEGTHVDAELHDLLVALARQLHGRLAIVSGRPLEVLREFGLGDLWLAGSHGLELAPPRGDIERPARPATIDEAQRVLEAFAATRPGVLVEPKSLGVGLHYRLAPERQRECTEVMQQLAQTSGLALQFGKMMLELRPGGADKGTVIEQLLARAPFHGHRAVFMGDDVTDEDGFEAMQRVGGDGVLVGPERQSHAAWRLDDVEAVRWLLRASTGSASPRERENAPI